MQLKKFQNVFRGFGIFSKIVRVTFVGTYCLTLGFFLLIMLLLLSRMKQKPLKL